MTHGDDQRIGGELGYTASDLPVASQDDVDAASPELTAADIEADSTTLAGVGVTVQAVLEELDDVTVANTAAIAAIPAGPTVKKQAADVVIAGSVAADSDFTQAVAANEVYAFSVIARFTSVDNGDSAQLKFSAPAGATWCGNMTTVNSGGTAVHGFAVDTAAVSIIGDGNATSHVMRIDGIITNGATPGTFKFIVDAGGAATLKKGSVMYIQKTA